MSLGVESLSRKELESLVSHLKAISSLQQFKTPLNACFNLVLICKYITPQYGRTRSKHFFSSAGTFSFKTLINKVFRVTIVSKYSFQKS